MRVSAQRPAEAGARLTTLSAAEINAASAAVAASVRRYQRVALWAEPTLESIIAIIASYRAGLTLVPLNPSIGSHELRHVLAESRPEALLAAPQTVMPGLLAALPQVPIDASCRAREISRSATDPESPALIIFTSGTTGPPKGALIPYRAIAANISGLQQAWRWSADDVLVQALPLFHVHGLVLGVLGPWIAGSALVHPGPFDTDTVAKALGEEGTILFGVPTMYHRLAAQLDHPPLVHALRRARLLVSGSASLSPIDRDRIFISTGRRVIERYGLTETLIVCAARAEDDAPGSVGLPLEGVEVRLIGDAGEVVEGADQAGEIQVRGTSLFSGYVGGAGLASALTADGWFATGDVGLRDAQGRYRVLGRSSLDIIKTGGFKVGAHEVEDVLRLHPSVVDVAVTGAPDAELGQRIAAWVVVRPGEPVSPSELQTLVCEQLAPHKRPREIHVVDSLPRTPVGKVEKHKLLSRGVGSLFSTS
jgi:malonyl-CoA/methylmalonyl-CoA synthetase